MAFIPGVHAETLDWSYPGGTTNILNQATSTPSSTTVNGVTITTSATRSGNDFETTQFNVTQINTAQTYPSSPNTGMLVMAMNAANNRGGIASQTATIAFDEPVYNVTFTINDIDGGPTFSFRDQIAVTSSGGVATSSTVGSGIGYNTGTGVAVANQNAGVNDATGDLTLTFAGPITSITIVHTAMVVSATNPAYQVINVDDITFLRSPRLTINKAFTPAGLATTFNFSISNSATATTSVNVPATGAATNSAQLKLTAVATATTVTETGPANWSFNSANASCTDSNSAVSGNPASFTAPVASSGLSFTIAATNIKAAAVITCAVTNAARPTLQLAKAWGANYVVGNIASIGATTGGSTNTTAFVATAGVAGSSTTATITVGNTITFPAETFTTGTAANYNTVLSCTAGGGATANSLSGTDGQTTNTLVIGPGDAAKAIVCTYTNTRKSTTLRVDKVWSANSIAGNAISIGATTGLTNNTATLASTAIAAGNTTAGTSVTVFAGETATFAAEGFTSGTAANYNTVLACSGGTLTGTDGQAAGNTLAITPASTSAAIVCSYTNTRKSTTFRLAKAWAANSIAGDVASIGVTTGLINNTALFTSTASTNTNGTFVTVFAGETATLPAETLTTGTLANYTTVVACSGGTLTGTNGQVAGNTVAITPAATAAAITCTYTNTRKSTTLRVDKAWGANSIAGNVASIGASTGLINNTALLTSTASTNSTGTAVTVYAGEIATLAAETLTTGTLTNYGTVITCSGGTLGGSDGQVTNTLTVTAASTASAIVCTYTNTRKSTTFRLAKAWGANSIAGDVASIGATTGLGSNTVLFTSTASTNTNGAFVTVYAGETATLPAETLTTGTLANYGTVVACSGGTLTGTDGQVAGNTLLVTGASTAAAITCTYTNTRKSTTLTLSKVWGANSIAGNVASIGATTGLTNNTALFTSTASTGASSTAVTVYAGETATLAAETMTTGTLANYTTVVACSAGTLTGTDGQAAGNTIAITPASTAAAITCSYTNTRKSTTFRLAKAWGANSIAGDVASIGVTTGLINNTALFTSTASTNTNGTFVTVYAGETATLPAETLTTGTLANYGTVVACSGGTLTGTDGQIAGNTVAITPAATAAAITCTYTNTRKSTTLTLSKVWGANSIAGNVASIGATTGLTNNTVLFTSTASTGASSAAVTVYAGETATLAAETMTTGTLANYTTVVACSAGTLTGTDGQAAGNTVAITPASTAAAITCTYTNTRKSTTFRLAKAWGANSIAGNVASIGVTTGLINNTILFTSTASTGTNGTFVTVYAGETATLPAETMTTGTLANYGTVVACSGGTLTGTDGQVATNTVAITAASTAAAITCTYTNTRKSTTLTLSKIWSANSIAGNVASIGATTGLTNNTALFTSTASTGASSTAVTVYAGETATLAAETMTTGTLANYTTVVACSAGALTGTDGQVAGNTIAITPASTAAAITCSYTNTRKSTTFRLAKAWGANSIAGNVASIGVTTGLINNTALFTSTASTNTNGTFVTVYAGETATLPAETLTTGTLANYGTVVACSGGTLTGTDGQVATNTVAITAASTAAAITCTYTNTRKSTTLTLSKAWGANSIAGNVASIGATTGLTNNTVLFTSTASTGSSSTAVTVYAGETATLAAETMTTGTLANYTTAVACSAGTLTGTDGQVAGNTIAITPASTAAAITCSYTNTRKSTTFTISKAWGANSIAGNVASIGATTGLTNNTVLFTSTASTGASSTAVTVYAGETATLAAETMTTGTLANYTTVVACSAGTLTGTDGQVAGNTVAITPASTAAAITCTYTNTRKSTTFRLAKAWGANSIAGNVASIGVTSGLINNTALFTSTASTNTNGTFVTVFAGETATLPAETMTTGTLANYGTVVSCSGGTLTGTDGQVATNTVAITAASTAAAITCTYTNTRKSTTLTLSKVWGANSIAGNVASIGATTGLTNNSALFTSTASTGASSTAVTVYAGETATLAAETMTTGTLANYTTVVACSAGTLTGTDGQVAGNTLAITAASTGAAITCSYTNTRKSTTFRLVKAWGANSIAGNVASIGVTTGLINNTALFTSTASTNTNGTFVTVYAGETATLPAETMTTGTLANYGTVVACSGGTLTGTDGQVATNTVAITAASTAAAITCTYTNTRKSATLTLRKTWVNGTAGHTATVTTGAGFINAATSGLSTSTGNNTTTGTAVTVYAAESGAVSESGSNMGLYIQALACSGTSGLSGTTLTVGSGDTAIVCTYTNTLATPSLAVSKTPSTGSVAAAGQVVTYTIAVNNSGNVAATAITVSDPLGSVSCPGGNPIPNLAIGATVNCTLSYTVPQSVFDNDGGGDGDIDNTATASGSTAFGAVNQSGVAVVTLSGGATLTLSKQVYFPAGAGGDVNGNGKADAGDIITYRYDVTNSGNRTVTGVAVGDSHNAFGAVPAPSSPTVLTDVAPANDSTDLVANSSWDSLAPGDTLRFTWAYTVVQQDVDNLQ